MEEFNIDLPEGMLTPEEEIRFLKLKSDVAAFYEKHGDHISFLEQAAEADLLEVEELTPDERQYLEEVAKLTDEYEEEMKEIEGFEELKEAQERFQTLRHLQREMKWFQALTTRKRVEAAKGLLKYFNIMLTAAQQFRENNPVNPELDKNIEELSVLIEYLISQNTTSELSLDATDQQSDN